MQIRRMLVLAGLVTTVVLGSGRIASAQGVRLPAAERRLKALPFPKDLKWLNTDKKLDLAGNLKGHVVILDFWTYCCINCIHILPDLHYIEKKYAGKPVVVIGVHAAKFKTEDDPKNISQAIQRYRIEHPVLHDKGGLYWRSWAVQRGLQQAWPSFAFIDSAGRFVGYATSEGQRGLMDAVVKQLLEEGKKEGTLAKKAITLKPTLLKSRKGQLAFPGKIASDAKTKRLFIADSNNDRILVTDTKGKVLHVIGSGKAGFKDGDFKTAEFLSPQGMVIDGDVIYLADTDNHALRKIDLKAGKVTTLAGTGKRAYDRIGGEEIGMKQGLASPWALEKKGDLIYIANAGTHQLWVHDLKTGKSKRFTGSGREHITDGGPSFSALAQPSGLVILDGQLYFADSEGSAIRRAALKDGRVETLVGAEGERGALFDFGYRDGKFEESKFQHALGVAVLDGNIVVADTYNNRIRLMDLKAKTTSTLYGNKGELDEPAGLTVLDGIIYIADTNNHRIMKFDPKTKKGEEFKVLLPKPTPKDEEKDKPKGK